MSLKLEGCMNLVARMHDDDQETLLARLQHYQDQGIPPERAQLMAAHDTLSELQADHDEFMGQVKEQHPDMFKASIVEPPAPEPQPEEQPHERAERELNENVAAGKTVETISDGNGNVEPRSKLNTPGARIVDSLKAIKEGFLEAIMPMAAGSEYARKIAKDYANADRLARWQWQQFDDLLTKNFSNDELIRMWNAGDEENEIRSGRMEAGPGKGLDSLPPKQREVIDKLTNYGEDLLERARQVGMFEGNGVPYWVPRVAVMIGENGEVWRPPNALNVGSDITASTPSLKTRTRVTAADSEAGMKAVLGKEATLIRNVRTMPLAMAKLERAIAGRELVNAIKDHGSKLNLPLVTDREGDGYFTMEKNPAFRTWQAVTSKDVNTGKDVTTMQWKPLYMSNEFRGPLKAISYYHPNIIFRGLNTLKAKSMSVIMYSPLIHNAVEWGRALPMAPLKVASLQIYFQGHRVMKDPEMMRKLISGGLVPIGHNGGLQDITGIATGNSLEPGRSWTAKMLAAPVGVFSDNGAVNVKRAVDWLGDKWHYDLLWKQVAALQAGLGSHLREQLLQKGLDDSSATTLAAHWANRFAGALPNEAMSAWAKQAANLAFFSRSFTFGNIGALKDMITGMPKDVQAQIMQNSGQAALATATSMARRKAAGAFLMDIGIMYASQSLAQDMVDYLRNGHDVHPILKGYLDRLHALMSKPVTTPVGMINAVLQAPGSLISTANNEPRLKNRVVIGHETAPGNTQGAAIGMRLPFGKIGEDFTGWLTAFNETLHNKMSQFAKPMVQAFQNDNGVGQPLYDKNASGVEGWGKAIGAVAWNFMRQQIPLDPIESAVDWAKGNATDVDKFKVVGPLVGLTFKKGDSGGAEAGVMHQAEARYQTAKQQVMPQINDAMKAGDEEHARELMQSINMPPPEQHAIIKRWRNPEAAAMQPQSQKKFQRIATPEERDQLDQVSSSAR